MRQKILIFLSFFQLHQKLFSLKKSPTDKAKKITLSLSAEDTKGSIIDVNSISRKNIPQLSKNSLLDNLSSSDEKPQPCSWSKQSPDSSLESSKRNKAESRKATPSKMECLISKRQTTQDQKSYMTWKSQKSSSQEILKKSNSENLNIPAFYPLNFPCRSNQKVTTENRSHLSDISREDIHSWRKISQSLDEKLISFSQNEK